MFYAYVSIRVPCYLLIFFHRGEREIEKGGERDRGREGGREREIDLDREKKVDGTVGGR